MSVSASDIKFYRASANNDLSSNGGRISSNQITSGQLNNVLPNVPNSERTAGVTRYRKIFLRNENTGDLSLDSAQVFVGTPTDAGDYVQLHTGTDTDVQSDAEAYTNWAGAGNLETTAASGESSIDVTFPAAAGVYSGEAVWVHIDDGTNAVDRKVVGTPSWAGNTATIDLSGELGYNFSSTNTIVSTMIELGDVETSSSGWTETSSLGTYDESTYPVVLFNKGTVTDDFTLTFSSSTAFTCSGANAGSVGSGEITSDFQPVNGDSYYFKIDKDGWGGTWQSGDTVQFSTVHAGEGIWLKQVVPSGISSAASNSLTLEWQGESA